MSTDNSTVEAEKKWHEATMEMLPQGSRAQTPTYRVWCGSYMSYLWNAKPSKESQLSLPSFTCSEQLQSTHLQNLAQKLGKWVRVRRCSMPTAEGCSYRDGKTRPQWHLGRGDLTPWRLWLALSWTNPTWICISLRPRTLRVRCSGVDDSRASWAYLCFIKQYFAYPRCWSSVLDCDQQGRMLGVFLSPRPGTGLIRVEFSFNLSPSVIL